MTGQHSAPNFQAFDWLRDFFEPRCPRLPPPLLDLHDSTRVAQCARARDTRANRGPACSAAMTTTTTTAMAASAATVASANGVARGSRASAHPSRPPLAGRHGWRARPWLGRRARAPSRFAAVVRASRDGEGSGDTRRLKIFSVNDGTRPPDDARRDPPRRFARQSTPARIARPERLAPGSTHASASRRGSRARSRPHSPRRIAAMRDRDADRVRTRRARPDRDPPRRRSRSNAQIQIAK